VTNAPNALRSLFAYVLLVPTALVLGYLLATSNIGPNVDLSSLAPVVLVFALLSAPLLLKWHRALLLLSINMTVGLFFLPGSPPLWFATAALSLGLALFQRALDRDSHFVRAPSVIAPLLALGAVVFATGFLTGGFGTREFGGSQYGGKRYAYIFAALAAFFAIIARPTSPKNVNLFLGLYFLGGLVNVMSNVIPLMPSEFYWLALIFPVSTNDMGFAAIEGPGAEGIARFFGLTTAGSCAFYFLLGRYRVTELLSLATPGRFILFFGVLVASMFGGYRSALILLVVLFALVFWLEGLLRTKYALALFGACVLGFVALIPLANKLPLSVQRTLSFLPININPIAKYEAEGSSLWRLEMWEVLIPEVPKYFFKPKGMGIDGADMELTGELVRRGLAHSQDVALLAGDWHNGPLSVLIPFGIWGFVAWIWFLIASTKALWLNYKFGDASLRKANTLLLAYFVARAIVFFVIFGGFFTDLFMFTTTVALSLSLNNGVCGAKSRSLIPEATSQEALPELHVA
jgi:hypothetical protein